MFRLAVIAASCLAIVGCASPTHQNMQEDSASCAAAGFYPGTMAMAHCMITAAQSRASDNYLQQQNERDEAARQAQSDAEWRAHVQQEEDQMHSDAERTMSGASGGLPDNTSSPADTGISGMGMQCNAAGDDCTGR